MLCLGRFEIIALLLILLCLTCASVNAKLVLRSEKTFNLSMVDNIDSDDFSYTYNFSRENFTIIVLPDTQHYSENYPQIFDNQTQWINENKEKLNIVFVTHLGDIVNYCSDLKSWNNANYSMSKLDENVPWGILPGDQDGAPNSEDLINYKNYFGYERFAQKNWYGGAYQNQNTNNYQLFSAGGDDYLIFHLQHAPSLDILTWANNTIKQYSNRKVIVSTHDYLIGFGINLRSDVGIRLWNYLIKPNSDQIFLVLCGHWPEEGRRSDTTENYVIHQLLADYQFRDNGGDGWLRILQFSPIQDKIYVKTYSPYLDKYETDSNSQFTLDHDMTALNANITIYSNSTISQFVYNQSLTTISFELSGEEGTIGYCNSTIPKEIINSNLWTVKIDGEVWNFTTYENITYSSIYFNYKNSNTLLIEIKGSDVIPEFSYSLILPIIIIATILVIIFYSKLK